MSSAEKRLLELESVYLSGQLRENKSGGVSLDTLLDIFVLLYDECANSTLRRERSVSDYIKYGMYSSNLN